MKKIVSKLVSVILGKKYVIDPDVSINSLFIILFERFLMVLRGLPIRLFTKKAKGIIFVGKKVTFKHLHLIEFMGNATIKDGCIINAFSKNGIKIGKNFVLGENSVIECTGVMRNLGEGLIIGENVGISANAFLGVRGSVKIGDNTIIGPNFYLHSENHNFESQGVLIRDQGESRKGIYIGENCWIGSNVTILDGVKIGNGCVIAAGAVVNKNIEDNAIVAGVPAKKIRQRGDLNE